MSNFRLLEIIKCATAAHLLNDEITNRKECSFLIRTILNRLGIKDTVELEDTDFITLILDSLKDYNEELSDLSLNYKTYKYPVLSFLKGLVDNIADRTSKFEKEDHSDYWYMFPNRLINDYLKEEVIDKTVIYEYESVKKLLTWLDNYLKVLEQENNINEEFLYVLHVTNLIVTILDYNYCLLSEDVEDV